MIPLARQYRPLQQTLISMVKTPTYGILSSRSVSTTASINDSYRSGLKTSCEIALPNEELGFNNNDKFGSHNCKHGRAHCSQITLNEIQSAESKFVSQITNQRSGVTNGILSMSALRFAPKKKAKGGGKDDGGGGASAAPKDPGAYHLYNIFAERQDPVIQADDSCYPKWLFQAEKPAPGYGELSLMFIYGHNIEDANLYLYMRFLKMHRKLQIKMNNLKLKKGKRRLQLKW